MTWKPQLFIFFFKFWLSFSLFWILLKSYHIILLLQVSNRVKGTFNISNIKFAEKNVWPRHCLLKLLYWFFSVFAWTCCRFHSHSTYCDDLLMIQKWNKWLFSHRCISLYNLLFYWLPLKAIELNGFDNTGFFKNFPVSFFSFFMVFSSRIVHFLMASRLFSPFFFSICWFCLFFNLYVVVKSWEVSTISNWMLNEWGCSMH